MASEMSERVNTPVSTGELERRWAAVRQRMDEEGFDVLLASANNDHMGGYVKYLTDVPALNGYPLTVVFPRREPMTVVTMGPYGRERELPPDGDGFFRGVARLLTTPSFASAAYTSGYDAELAARALAPYATGRIGLVSPAQLGYALVDGIRRALPGASFADASEVLDTVRMVKSDEELALIRRTAEVQDLAMAAAAKAIAPGKKESDVAAVAQLATQELGTEQGIYLCASTVPGQPAFIAGRHNQDRRLREGDIFYLLVETNGPGGLYTELGRTFTLGPAPQQLIEEYAFTLEAQRFCTGLLVPGAACAEVFAAYNEFMREHGRNEEERLHCHGQGYDLVERPLVRFDETARIEAGMNLACHPRHVANGVASWVCDNFVIGPEGAGESIHSYPPGIVEIA